MNHRLFYRTERIFEINQVNIANIYSDRILIPSKHTVGDGAPWIRRRDSGQLRCLPAKFRLDGHSGRRVLDACL